MKKHIGLECLGLGMALLLAASPLCAAAEEILVYTALEDDQVPRYLDSFKKEHPEITDALDAAIREKTLSGPVAVDLSSSAEEAEETDAEA